MHASARDGSGAAIGDVKEQTPASLGMLAGAGTLIVGNVVVGFVLGYFAARYLHWTWALPFGIILGFISGFVSMYRRLSRLS